MRRQRKDSSRPAGSMSHYEAGNTEPPTEWRDDVGSVQKDSRSFDSPANKEASHPPTQQYRERLKVVEQSHIPKHDRQGNPSEIPPRREQTGQNGVRAASGVKGGGHNAMSADRATARLCLDAACVTNTDWPRNSMQRDQRNASYVLGILCFSLSKFEGTHVSVLGTEKYFACM